MVLIILKNKSSVIQKLISKDFFKIQKGLYVSNTITSVQMKLIWKKILILDKSALVVYSTNTIQGFKIFGSGLYRDNVINIYDFYLIKH